MACCLGIASTTVSELILERKHARTTAPKIGVNLHISSSRVGTIHPDLLLHFSLQAARSLKFFIVIAPVEAGGGIRWILCTEGYRATIGPALAPRCGHCWQDGDCEGGEEAVGEDESTSKESD